MKTVQISLNSIDKVKSFVNAITQFEFDFDLISGRYVIDAKSIMGIFSLDLSKPIDLAIKISKRECACTPFFSAQNHSCFLCFYKYRLRRIDRFLHQFINLLFQFLFRISDHFKARLGNRMLCNKDRTAVLKRLD